MVSAFDTTVVNAHPADIGIHILSVSFLKPTSPLSGEVPPWAPNTLERFVGFLRLNFCCPAGIFVFNPVTWDAVDLVPVFLVFLFPCFDSEGSVAVISASAVVASFA